jgi:hypothetical protein
LEVRAPAAGHHAPPVTAANSEGELEYRRQNDDTIRFVDYTLRNIVRNVQDLLHYPSGIFDSVLFLILPESGRHTYSQQNYSKPNSLHIVSSE